MDLILWRHAEAQDHPYGEQGEQGDPLDLERRLTPRGEKQATRMAAWLDRQLPDGAKVYVSPAERARQTANALGLDVTISDKGGAGEVKVAYKTLDQLDEVIRRLRGASF